MAYTLLELPTWLLGSLIIVPCIVLTLLGARVLHRKMPAPVDNEALVALHATVSTIYTVLLAFVVVVVWQQLSDAEGQVDTEATRLSNILRDSEALSPADSRSVTEAVHDYIHLASTRDWAAMARGREPDRQTAIAYERIWEAAYRIEPAGPRQEAFFRELVVRLNELGAARRTRLLSARASVPPVMWLLLVAGGLMVVVLSYLLPHGSRRGSNLALGATSGVIAITLFLIFAMDHPYSGDLRVDPSPLTDLIPRTEEMRVGGVSEAPSPRAS
ncbi:MAG TPA: hypothetical protein VHJ78_08355 [Actinomycetota bacterium]|nr:hypothetical protein [Actinomycetota bacterium]